MNILLVDHSQLYQEILAGALGAGTVQGQPLNHAVTGAQALALVQEKRFDFIAISMNLPDTDGIALTRELRKLSAHANAPIVILTSSPSAEMDRQAQNAGVTELFRKQDIEELVIFMRRFINLRRKIHARVLYVEDSTDQRLMLSALLRSWGLIVDDFDSADTAWSRFLENDYDLVISDVVMEGHMSGSRFINRIRRQLGSKGDVPILAVTSFDSPARRIALFSLGISDYIAKPVIQEELYARVMSLITTKQIIDRDNRFLHATMLAVASMDEQGIVQFANPELLTLFGYGEDEVLGQPFTRLLPEARHDEARLLISGWFAGELDAEQLRITSDVADATPMRRLDARRKNGEHFTVELTLDEIREADRRLLVILMRDITAQARAEAELRRGREMAEAASRTKSEFLSSVSHEIRTPISAVIGLARMGLRDGTEEKTRTTFGNILNAGEHLLGVINQVLDHSKLEARKLDLDPHAFDLGGLLADVNTLIREQAQQKGLALVVQQPATLPWVAGDAQRLRQILLNLLSNAIKFTATGTVRLHVERSGEQTRFAVSDTGIGMSAEQLERIFSPFEQADNSITRQYGGTGLGLSISAELARLMGGEITVQSTPGQGSTFTLVLPLPETTQIGAAPTTVAAESEARPDGTTTPRLPGLRVLAADDNEVNCMILEDLLIHEGAQVHLVTDGQAALDVLDTLGADAFDIVLTDVQMPGMDGYAATRAIHQRRANLPVIGLTAHVSPEHRLRCLASGMVDHLSKPYDTDALVAAIRRHVPTWPGPGLASSPRERA